MFAQERYQEIMCLLQKEKAVKVSRLTNKFQVSIETIRRDLEHLEKEGLLRRVHGGAVIEEIDSKELTFIDREAKHMEEKRELAEYAAYFVKEGQSIALDVSTTNTEFAKVLRKKFDRMTVLTNSLPIATELSVKPNFTILMPGGVLRNQEQCMVGEMAEKFISNFHVDFFFMSISGISLSSGLTDYGIGEIQVKLKMLHSAQKVIVLADSSKFDRKSFMHVCDLEKVDKIVTDSKLKQAIRQKYLEKGIDVVHSIVEV